MAREPEQYLLTPTPHVPNSVLPALVYRNALPSNPDSEKTRNAIEKNHWAYGDTWKTYWTNHFHSVTHECYAVFKGSSTYLLGRGPLDNPEGGVEVNVAVGDIIVLPAGVSHCSTTSEGDFSYVALYPEGSPEYDNNWGKASPEETAKIARTAYQVPIPEFDPIYGKDGPLPKIWAEAAASSAASSR